MLVNALRGHMAEFGLVEAQGLHQVVGLIAIVMDDRDERIPDIARQALKMITGQINELQARVAALEMQVLAWHKNNPVSQRLATIPGIGPIIATAIAATLRTRVCSAMAESLLLGSGWCQGRTQPVAKRASGG
jgi:transposase